MRRQVVDRVVDRQVDEDLVRKTLDEATAAVDGGRGFIEGFPDQILVNLAIDNAVYEACRRTGTKRVVYASSACVYPTVLQTSESRCPMLAEEQAGFDRPGNAFAEGAYGWCKLMGEFQLEQIAQRAPFTGAAARIFSAYGERENESHAVIALIAKAALRLLTRSPCGEPGARPATSPTSPTRSPVSSSSARYRTAFPSVP